MEHDLKISIITVVYNGEKTIERTIKSVIQQSYTYIEYIIIDGQSTDGTLAIINKYLPKITHIISEPDQGMYYAMNKGIALATGELIGIINSDDWYEEDAVSDVVTAYTVNPNAAIFHGLLKYWDIKGQLKAILGHHSTFLKLGMIEHPTCFVKRELYQKIGLFNLSYRYSADYEFMIRAFNQQVIFFLIPKILANFSAGGVSSSFFSSKETLSIQYRYQLISMIKQYILLFYWWLKQRK